MNKSHAFWVPDGTIQSFRGLTKSVEIFELLKTGQSEDFHILKSWSVWSCHGYVIENKRQRSTTNNNCHSCVCILQLDQNGYQFFLCMQCLRSPKGFYFRLRAAMLRFILPIKTIVIYREIYYDHGICEANVYHINLHLIFCDWISSSFPVPYHICRSKSVWIFCAQLGARISWHRSSVAFHSEFSVIKPLSVPPYVNVLDTCY